jgi:hypothetical protein
MYRLNQTESAIFIRSGIFPSNTQISEKEILSAVESLKNNKSAGLGGFRNEMLKYGISYLLSCLNKLFNTI